MTYRIIHVERDGKIKFNASNEQCCVHQIALCAHCRWCEADQKILAAMFVVEDKWKVVGRIIDAEIARDLRQELSNE